MSTRKVVESERKGFLQQKKTEGVVFPQSLGFNEYLLVETKDYVYEIRPVEGNGRVYKIESASPLVLQQEVSECYDIWGHHKEFNIEEKFIGRDMSMILKYKTGTNLYTGKITGITVNGTREDGTTYSLDLWK